MREFIRGMGAASWALLALLVLVLITFGWCTYDARRDRRADDARVTANGQAVEIDTGARDAAADQRVTDTINTANTKQELSDAIEQLPDAVPSTRRVALECERLRRQGLREADLPAVCRPQGAGQAGPQP